MMSNTQGKLLASSILAMLLAGVWFLMVEPYTELWQDRIAQAERLQRKQLALRQLIGNRENFEQQYRALNDSEGLEQVFLDEKSGALADVKLQRVVKQIVEDSGAKTIQAAIKKKKPARKSKSGDTVCRSSAAAHGVFSCRVWPLIWDLTPNIFCSRSV